jgi:uncharacterized membrane protein
MNNGRFWRYMGGGVLLILVLALGGCGAKKAADLAPGTQLEAHADNDLVIPLAEVSEDARFFAANVDGTDIEVIAVRAPDGSVRTAFNTCQICYDSGNGYYVQDGDALVCQNCKNRFTTSQIEVVAGGCNPWPIFEADKSVDGEKITISHTFLEKSAALFANWKNVQY